MKKSTDEVGGELREVTTPDPPTAYRYTGSVVSGVTLASGEEVMLIPGTRVTLPARNDYVRTLVHQGLLIQETR